MDSCHSQIELDTPWQAPQLVVYSDYLQKNEEFVSCIERIQQNSQVNELLQVLSSPWWSSFIDTCLLIRNVIKHIVPGLNEDIQNAEY